MPSIYEAIPKINIEWENKHMASPNFFAYPDGLQHNKYLQQTKFSAPPQNSEKVKQWLLIHSWKLHAGRN